MTVSPTRTWEESPSSATVSPETSSTLITARSVFGSRPMIRAGTLRASPAAENVTVSSASGMSATPEMTWLLVRMWPSSSMTTPEPMPLMPMASMLIAATAGCTRWATSPISVRSPEPGRPSTCRSSTRWWSARNVLPAQPPAKPPMPPSANTAAAPSARIRHGTTLPSTTSRASTRGTGTTGSNGGTASLRAAAPATIRVPGFDHGEYGSPTPSPRSSSNSPPPSLLDDDPRLPSGGNCSPWWSSPLGAKAASRATSPLESRRSRPAACPSRRPHSRYRGSEPPVTPSGRANGLRSFRSPVTGRCPSCGWCATPTR